MKAIIYIIILVASITPHILHSQERYLPPQDLKQETFLTEPSTLRKGYFRIETFYIFSNGNTSFNNEGETGKMPEIWSRFSQEFNVGFTFGITDRFQIRVNLPYKYDVDETAFKTSLIKKNDIYTIHPKHITKGFGDLGSELAFQIIPQISRNYGLTSIAGVILPTGEKNPENGIDYLHYSPPSGYGRYELYLTLKFRQILFPFNYEVKTSFSKYYGVEKMVLDLEKQVYTGIKATEKYNNFYYSAASLGYLINDWMGINNDFDYFYTKSMNLSQLSSEEEWNYSLNYGLSVYFQLKRFRLVEKFSVPLFGKSFPSSKLFLLRLQYTL